MRLPNLIGSVICSGPSVMQTSSGSVAPLIQCGNDRLPVGGPRSSVGLWDAVIAGNQSQRHRSAT